MEIRFFSGYGYDVHYATLSDGINWTKCSGNPAIHGSEPFVIKNGNIYEMWYETGHTISYAIFMDGINWNILTGNLVFEPGPCGSWEEESVNIPSAIKEDSSYPDSGISDLNKISSWN